MRSESQKRGHKRQYSEKQKAKRRGTSLEWKKKNVAYVKKYQAVLNKSEKGVLQRLFDTAKRRAKETGLEFSIKRSELCLPVLCPLLCIPVFVGNGKQGPNSPSVDRIDNSKGYVPGNVWIISQKANRIKSDATVEEISMLARNLSMLMAFRKI
jgi:hypothetical protein